MPAFTSVPLEMHQTMDGNQSYLGHFLIVARVFGVLRRLKNASLSASVRRRAATGASLPLYLDCPVFGGFVTLVVDVVDVDCIF